MRMYLSESVGLQGWDMLAPLTYPKANTRTLKVKSVSQSRLVAAIQRQRINNFNFRVFIHGVNVRRIKHTLSSTNNTLLFKMLR